MPIFADVKHSHIDQARKDHSQGSRHATAKSTALPVDPAVTERNSLNSDIAALMASLRANGDSLSRTLPPDKKEGGGIGGMIKHASPKSIFGAAVDPFKPGDKNAPTLKVTVEEGGFKSSTLAKIVNVLIGALDTRVKATDIKNDQLRQIRDQNAAAERSVKEALTKGNLPQGSQALIFATAVVNNRDSGAMTPVLSKDDAKALVGKMADMLKNDPNKAGDLAQTKSVKDALKKDGTQYSLEQEKIIAGIYLRNFCPIPNPSLENALKSSAAPADTTTTASK